LGYTTIFKLQNSGFQIRAYDPNRVQSKLFVGGKYPSREQIAIWSAQNYLPKIDATRIEVFDDPSQLFKSCELHMIAIPESQKNGPQENVTTKLAEIFWQNLKKNGTRPLIVFESAFVPGHIEKYFVGTLKRRGLHCDKDYYLATLFRNDWNIEAFLSQKDKMPIAGGSRNSLSVARELFEFLSLPTVELGSIKEAEIYVNSINAIQAMVNDFVRQLALGYPSVNAKRLSELLFRNINLDDCALNIGTGGAKMTLAIDNLIRGSQNSGDLTLLREFQEINISSVLNYAEYIVRQSYKSVAILGVTYKGNQKDLTLSPSVTLAEYLLKNSVRVLLNDSFCSKKEINKLVKGAEVVGFPDGVFSADVLILAADHNDYKYMTQADLDAVQKKTKLVIDNYGIWSHLSFGNKVKYHRVGDGTLNPLR
jgi:UDP-N-acetyl-D-mannosaminuronate dehydrogenase